MTAAGEVYLDTRLANFAEITLSARVEPPRLVAGG